MGAGVVSGVSVVVSFFLQVTKKRDNAITKLNDGFMGVILFTLKVLVFSRLASIGHAILVSKRI